MLPNSSHLKGPSMPANSSICQPIPFPPLQLFTPSQPQDKISTSLTLEKSTVPKKTRSRIKLYTNCISLPLLHRRHVAKVREALTQVQAVASSQAQWPSLAAAAQSSKLRKTFHPFLTCHVKKQTFQTPWRAEATHERGRRGMLLKVWENISSM